MGVSRSSLREALRALAMLGVAEMRHGDGTYLTSLDAGRADAPGRARARAVSDAGLAELFEARKLVEPGLAALAAERIDDAAAAELHAAREAQRRRARGRRGVHVADIELHAQIARAAYNAILSRLLDSIARHGHRQPPPHRAPGARARAERARPSRDRRGDRGARRRRRPARAMLRHLENVERAVTDDRAARQDRGHRAQLHGPRARVRDGAAEEAARVREVHDVGDRPRASRSGSRASSPSASTGRSSWRS